MNYEYVDIMKRLSCKTTMCSLNPTYLLFEIERHICLELYVSNIRDWKKS